MKVVWLGVSTLLLLLGALGMVLIAADKRIEVEKLRKQEQVVDRLTDAVVDRLAHGQAERRPVAERVRLPDVEGHFWLTFLYADNWRNDPESARLNQMFHEDPRLVSMRRRCRVNTFSQMDPYLVERWRKYVGDATPMLVLQAPDGRLCYKTSRGNIPPSADELIAQLQQSLDEHFHRPCPRPEPEPAEPRPAPVAPVNPLPDTVRPDEPPRDAGDPLWLLAALGVAGAAIGVALGRKRR